MSPPAFQRAEPEDQRRALGNIRSAAWRNARRRGRRSESEQHECCPLGGLPSLPRRGQCQDAPLFAGAHTFNLTHLAFFDYFRRRNHL